MPSPIRVFLWLFLVLSLFGLLVGTINLMNPKAVHIPFGPNGESAEGIDGVLASLFSSMVLGAFIGGLAAILAWLARMGTRRAKQNKE